MHRALAWPPSFVQFRNGKRVGCCFIGGNSGIRLHIAVCRRYKSGSRRPRTRRIAGIPPDSSCSISYLGYSQKPVMPSDKLSMQLTPAVDNAAISILSTLSSRVTSFVSSSLSRVYITISLPSQIPYWKPDFFSSEVASKVGGTKSSPSSK